MNKFFRLISMFIFIALVMTGSKIYAKNATLTNIEISDAESGYNIVIDSDKNIKYQKKLLSPDKISIKLEKANISNNLQSSYKNATGVEHVLIKPVFGGTIMEITGKNAQNSTISFNNQAAGSTFPVMQILLLPIVVLIAGIIGVKYKKNRQFTFSTTISAEDNKILETAFAKKGGLIAQGIGSKRVLPSQPFVQNVRKVKFLSEYELKEINLR